MEGQEPTVNPPDGQEPEGPGGQEPTNGERTDEGQAPDKFDAKYVKELRQDAAKTRKALQAAEARLREFEDRDKTELEKLTARADAADQKAADAQRQLLKLEVAAHKQLTADWVDRLRGDTIEELEADADRLLGQIAQQYQPPPARTSAFDGGARQKPAEKRTPEQEHNQFLLGVLGRPQP